MNDYVVVCDYAYEVEDILLFEADVLEVLEFNLNQDSTYDFLSTVLEEMETTK